VQWTSEIEVGKKKSEGGKKGGGVGKEYGDEGKFCRKEEGGKKKHVVRSDKFLRRGQKWGVFSQGEVARECLLQVERGGTNKCWVNLKGKRKSSLSQREGKNILKSDSSRENPQRRVTREGSEKPGRGGKRFIPKKGRRRSLGQGVGIGKCSTLTKSVRGYEL